MKILDDLLDEVDQKQTNVQSLIGILHQEE